VFDGTLSEEADVLCGPHRCRISTHLACYEQEGNTPQKLKADIVPCSTLSRVPADNTTSGDTRLYRISNAFGTKATGSGPFKYIPVQQHVANGILRESVTRARPEGL